MDFDASHYFCWGMDFPRVTRGYKQAHESTQNGEEGYLSDASAISQISTASEVSTTSTSSETMILVPASPLASPPASPTTATIASQRHNSWELALVAATFGAEVVLLPC